MNPLSSELPLHVHNWLIISLKDFCIVIRKWPTFWPSRCNALQGVCLRETAYFSLVRSFLEYSATVWHPRQKYNSDKLEMVQRRAARFLKGRYGMFESVTQMLEQLTWTPLSKRRENSRLILFYKIINNLAVVPHSCLEKADVRTRKKHSQKFRHIGYNIDPYGQSFFPNCISAWNGLAKDIAEANTLDIFKSKLQN